jgi:protein SCO1/2
MYLWLLVPVFLIGAIGVFRYTGVQSDHDAFTLPRPAADFTLTTPDGTAFRLSHQRDQVVVLSFGYTFCPDVCPTTLVELAQVKALLGEAGKRIQVVFITLDPERDTPERLGLYMRAFDPSFIGLTGSPEQLARVRDAYRVIAKKQVVPGPSAAYLIAHSAYVYVIDPKGQLQLLFPFGTAIDAMVQDIQPLLEG